jgi:hypothetical protein
VTDGELTHPIFDTWKEVGRKVGGISPPPVDKQDELVRFPPTANCKRVGCGDFLCKRVVCMCQKKVSKEKLPNTNRCLERRQEGRGERKKRRNWFPTQRVLATIDEVFCVERSTKQKGIEGKL